MVDREGPNEISLGKTAGDLGRHDELYLAKKRIVKLERILSDSMPHRTIATLEADRAEECKKRGKAEARVREVQKFAVKDLLATLEGCIEASERAEKAEAQLAEWKEAAVEEAAQCDRLKAERNTICPCKHTTPCHPDCSCVVPISSRGCERCCAYGSKKQWKSRAESIANVWSERDEALATIKDANAVIQAQEMVINHTDKARALKEALAVCREIVKEHDHLETAIKGHALYSLAHRCVLGKVLDHD